MRRFQNDERGATAIEYGLIAGLIALGIVGSLVGARSSLNDDYSRIASYLGGSGSSTAAAPTNPVTSQRAVANPNTSSRYSYWNAKTLASKVVTNPTATSQQTKFTYTDGSIGTYVVNYDSTGKLLSESVTTYPFQGESGRNTDFNIATFAADGTLLTMAYTNPYANGTPQITSYVTSSNWHSEQVTFYNSDGSVQRQINNYDDPNVPTSMSKSTGDEIYFRGLSQ